MKTFALTTVDNPFDPFDDFDRWFAFDEEKGYHSSGLLARVTEISDELPESDMVRVVGDAIDFIILNDLTGIYKKVEQKAKAA